MITDIKIETDPLVPKDEIKLMKGDTILGTITNLELAAADKSATTSDRCPICQSLLGAGIWPWCPHGVSYLSGRIK